MDDLAPLTTTEVLQYAPTYDACVRDVIDHLPAELCDEFSRNVPYTTLCELIEDQSSPELDQRFATSILNLYHYTVQVAQHYSPTNTSELPPLSPETYCFLIDFWPETTFSFYDLSKLVMQGKDFHPDHFQLEQRINSLFSLVLED